MHQLPLSLQRYLFTVWAAGLLAWAAGNALSFELRPLSWPLFALLLALLIAAQSLPRHILTGTKVSPNTIPLFIAVLCLPVHAAVSLALIGVAISHALRRRPWYEVCFNAAAVALEVFVGGVIWVVLTQLNWSILAAVVVAAVALYTVDSSLVAGAVALQHGAPYGRIWRDIVGAEPFDHILMFLVAGLVALPWTWMPLIAGLLLIGLGVRLMLTRGRGWLPGRQRVQA